MGKLLSKIFGNKEMRILMLGLDAAGKTSILLMYTHTRVSVSFFFIYIYTRNFAKRSLKKSKIFLGACYALL